MENKKIIRAADYLPQRKNGGGGGFDYALPMSEQLLINLFGDMPDYSNPKHEELWQEIHNAEAESGIRYCLERGVDIIGDDGEPVDGWRDIAVMLKAIERGIIELADKADESEEAP